MKKISKPSPLDIEFFSIIKEIKMKVYNNALEGKQNPNSWDADALISDFEERTGQPADETIIMLCNLLSALCENAAQRGITERKNINLPNPV